MHDDDLYERLAQLTDSLERLGRLLSEAALLAGPRESRGDPKDQHWRAFLDEHAELTAVEPLQFTDDELLAAVPEAIRQWEEQRTNQGRRGVALDYTYSTFVAGVLAVGNMNAPVAKGNVVRVGRALARLSRAGRVRRLERKWESAARWQPVDDDETRGAR